MERAASNAAVSDLGGMLAAGAAWLERRGVADAILQCEWLAADILHCRRTELPLKTRPDDDAVAALRCGVKRLGAGEPIQYVIGNWDFRRLTLKTDNRALIPRPETEELVNLVLAEQRLWPRPVIWDVGTGTGAIALSLALERPDCKVVAVDCDKAALALAKENATAAGLDGRVEFVLGRNCADAEPGTLNAVVSNPPYIASAEVDELPVLIRDYEPRLALDGGADGLDIIRELVHDAAIALKKGGFIFLEIGDRQGADVLSLLESAGFSEATVIKDFSGKTRYAKGRIE